MNKPAVIIASLIAIVGLSACNVVQEVRKVTPALRIEAVNEPPATNSVPSETEPTSNGLQQCADLTVATIGGCVPNSVPSSDPGPSGNGLMQCADGSVAPEGTCQP